MLFHRRYKHRIIIFMSRIKFKDLLAFLLMVNVLTFLYDFKAIAYADDNHRNNANKFSNKNRKISNIKLPIVKLPQIPFTTKCSDKFDSILLQYYYRFITWWYKIENKIDHFLVVKNLTYPYDMTDENDFFKELRRSVRIECNRSLISYSSYVIYLQHMLLNKALAKAKARGGENASQVIGRSEDDEYYILKNGVYTLPCQLQKLDNFELSTFCSRCLKLVTVNETNKTPVKAKVEKGFTIAITRYEYANVYWSVMDMYNIFVVMRFFNQTPENTNVIWLDAHSKGHLDNLWKPLFRNVTPLSELSNVTRFDHFVFPYNRVHGPLLRKELSELPLIKDFRSFILTRFKLSLRRSRNCSSLNVLFVWRHDYLNHPRNPKKAINRKISNEQEILMDVRKTFPMWNVNGFCLEELSSYEQVKLISQSDIYIGMHGAAMTFSFLLQPGSAVIEFFPKDGGPNWHMEYIAKWSNHTYFTWKNNKDSLKDVFKRSTHIPLDIIHKYIDDAHKNICKSKK